MSAQAVHAPRTRRAAKPLPSTSSRPQLSVVRALNPARSTLPMVVVVLVVLAGALIANLVIMGHTTHVAGEVQRTRDELSQTREAIVVDQKALYERSASTALVSKAASLGMVPGLAPGVVDLRGSTVTKGKPAPAPSAPAPAPGAPADVPNAPSAAPNASADAPSAPAEAPAPGDAPSEQAP